MRPLLDPEVRDLLDAMEAALRDHPRRLADVLDALWRAQEGGNLVEIVADLRRRTSRRGYCSEPDCGRLLALRVDGMVRLHRSDGADDWYCPGGGLPPKGAAPERERAAKAGRP